MLRTFFATAAVVLTLCASSAALAVRHVEQAEDRFTEALLSVEYSGIVAGAAAEAAPTGPMLLDNPGNARAFVMGCEDACQNARVRLRVAGMPDLVARGSEAAPRTVVLAIPRSYARALSNFEVVIEIDCGRRTDHCAHRWALLSQG